MSPIPHQLPCSPNKPREPTFPAAPTKSPFNKPKPYASARPNFPSLPPWGVHPPPSLHNLACNNRDLLQELLREERTNARHIDDLTAQVRRNAQATKQLTRSVTDLCSSVKSLNKKIHLNNQHIKALQDQVKLALSSIEHACVLVKSIDNCLDNVSDEFCDQRNTLDTLMANLPYIVATQVHRGINLTKTNKPLSVDCRQYVHLSPKQDALIRELYHGNLNPLLLNKIETNSRYN